mgnify:CR=1 FL=1
MSRIGKKPIDIPAGVEVKVEGSTLTVKGPKGTLTQSFNACLSYELSEKELIVKRPDDSKEHKMIHGTTRALIHNMVVGVSEGFKRVLEIQGIGYKAQMRGNNLVLNVGHSHEDVVVPPEGIALATPNANTIEVTGIDAQKVGQVSALIRSYRRPEPYHGKGIRYQGEQVLLRAAKSSKKDK